MNTISYDPPTPATVTLQLTADELVIIQDALRCRLGTWTADMAHTTGGKLRTDISAALATLRNTYWP